MGNVEDMDQRIATIEFKLWTESIPLKEEKALLAEIQKLKKDRPKVHSLKGLRDQVGGGGSLGATTKEERDLLRERLNILRDQRAEVSKRLAELNAKRDSEVGDLKPVMNKREELGNKIKEQIDIRNKVRDEWREAEREYREYENKVRDWRRQRQEAERKARQDIWELEKREKMAEKLDDQPYVQEIALIEQTLLFCKNLTQTKAAEEKEEKKDIKHNNPDDTVVLAKKDERDEFYYAPTAKGKKAKAKGKKQSDGPKPIKHNAETFRLFDRLKLDAPITTDELPATMEKLEEKLANFHEKVRLWEEQKEEKKQRILKGDYSVLHDDKDDTKKEEKTETSENKEQEKEGNDAEEEKEEEKEEEDEKADSEGDGKEEPKEEDAAEEDKAED